MMRIVFKIWVLVPLVLIVSGCVFRGPSWEEKVHMANSKYSQNSANLSKQEKKEHVSDAVYSEDAATAVIAVKQVRSLFDIDEAVTLLTTVAEKTRFYVVEEAVLNELSQIKDYGAYSFIIEYIKKYRDSDARYKTYKYAISALKQTELFPIRISLHSNNSSFPLDYKRNKNSFFEVVEANHQAIIRFQFTKYNVESHSVEMPGHYEIHENQLGHKINYSKPQYERRWKSGYTSRWETGEFEGTMSLESASGELLVSKDFSIKKGQRAWGGPVNSFVKDLNDDFFWEILPQLVAIYPEKMMSPQERERRAIEVKAKINRARRAERTVLLSMRTRKGECESKPLKHIERIVRGKEKAYAELGDHTFPSEVVTPSLPPALKLVQGKYEADSVFTDRVKLAQQKRQYEIDSIQRQYKKKISERNKQIEELQTIQKQRLKELPDKREIFIAEAVKDVFKGIRVDNAYYNRKTAVLSLDLHASGASYTQKIGAKLLDPNIIESIAERPKSANWTAFFRGKGDSFVLDKVECSANGNMVAFKEMKEEVVLAEGKPQTVTIAQADVSELNSIESLQKQAPDLADYNNTVTLKFNDGRVVRVTGDTELARQVAALASAKGNSNHHLLAIGIESYKSAAAVPFAENSLKIMSQLIAKQYGVPKKNQIVLSGNAATGQAIQGHLRNLTARMGEEDTLFFYYAGHGLAGKDGREVYMVPCDVVRGAYVDDDFAFSTIINEHFAKAGRVYAFLDTCFSGRASTQTMLTEGVAPVYKTSAYELPKNVTVFFAGKGDQYANYYPEKGHRLFSYYVARAMLDGKGNIAEMDTYVRRSVRDTSARMGADHLQEPFVSGNKERKLGE